MVPRDFTVTRRVRTPADTATVWLEPVDGTPFSFEPGQFTMLQAFGVGEVPISISGDPAETGVLQHTVRDVGAVSRALAVARVGTRLGVRGPFGTGWDVGSARGGDVVVVAGGIGLAPLRPAMLEISAHRDDFGAVSLLYGARTPADMLFTGELLELGDRAPDQRRRSPSTGRTTPGTAGSVWSPPCSTAPGSTRSGPWPWSAAPR